MPKLTLSIDSGVVTRAKRLAKRQGTSISKMVETYLALVSEPAAAPDTSPLVRELRGLLKAADKSDYREHIARKYR